MDTKKKEVDFDFQSWIKEQYNDDYQIVEDNESLKAKLSLVNQYELGGVASWEMGMENNDTFTIINQNLD